MSRLKCKSINTKILRKSTKNETGVLKEVQVVHVRIQMGTWTPDPPPPLKNPKAIGFLTILVEIP